MATKIEEAQRKVGYLPTEIESEAIGLVTSFIRDTDTMQTWVTPDVSYNCREVIKQCARHYLGIFQDSAFDHLGQEKVWNQITQSFVESEVTNTDIDPKDVQTEADTPPKMGVAALLRPLIRRWMRIVDFGQDMDDDIRYRAIFGHIVRKVTEKYNPDLKGQIIDTRRVDLLRWYVNGNADNLHDSACAEMAILTKAEVIRDFDTKWMNLKYLKGKDTVYQYPETLTTSVKLTEPTSEIYEYHAEIPTWWIDGDREKWNKDGKPYKLGIVIISNIFDCPVVHKIMLNKRGIKPYEESRLIKVPNRYLGMGRGEQLFGYQLYLNIKFNTRRVNQLLAANQLFSFRKGSGITAQMLAKVMTGGAIPRNAPDDITRIDTRDYNFADSITEERSLIDSAQRLTAQSDIALGGQIPNNTPATIGVLQDKSQGRSVQMSKESFGRYLERLFNRHIIPELWKTLKKGDILAIKDDPAVLRKIDETLITYFVNTELLKQYEQGNIVLPEQVEMEKQRLMQQFASMGKQRWLEIQDEYFETVGVGVVVNVSDEHSDKDSKMKALWDLIFNLPKTNPEYDMSDAINAAVDLLELPIELKLKSQMQAQSQMQMNQMTPQGQPQSQLQQPQGQQAPSQSSILQRANSLVQ